MKACPWEEKKNKRLYFYKDNLRKKCQSIATETLCDIPQAYVNPVK